MWRVIVILFFNVQIAFACNGYTLKVNYVRNCDEKNVIDVQKGYHLDMDKNCNIMVKGCLNFTKPIKTAKATYSIKKEPFPPIEGEVDVCTALVSNKDIMQISQSIQTMGLPKICPMPAKKYCASPDKKISLAQYKNQMVMAAGTTEVKLEVEHDSGKTCCEYSVTISKPNKA